MECHNCSTRFRHCRSNSRTFHTNSPLKHQPATIYRILIIFYISHFDKYTYCMLILWNALIWIRCKDQVKLSVVDRLIHNCKFYLDGTPKRGPNSPTEDEKIYMVQAVLDQYNEDHNLFGGLVSLPPSLITHTKQRLCRILSFSYTDTMLC